MGWRQLVGRTVVLLVLVHGKADAQIRISEWMYNGLGSGSIGEFVELTNFGLSSVDLTGWSFDDSSRTPGSQSLTGLGSILPGQSAIFTDMTASDFRTNWGLSPSIPVLGGNTNNLGRADEINVYDASNALVDRLTYDDQTMTGTPCTNGTSGLPKTLAATGMNDATLWKFAAFGDGRGSKQSAAGEIANPGFFTAVPESSCLVLLAIGMSGAAAHRSRRL